MLASRPINEGTDLMRIPMPLILTKAKAQVTIRTVLSPHSLTHSSTHCLYLWHA